MKQRGPVTAYNVMSLKHEDANLAAACCSNICKWGGVCNQQPLSAFCETVFFSVLHKMCFPHTLTAFFFFGFSIKVQAESIKFASETN